ncbi:MAG: TRAP transporter small permease [Planctomycetaceae bacterium]|jgi:C4-dicarboxylate transporter DctQ subunit|nr:TRAP transporter small permease [Planctomycetaceae bacterium]
MKDQPSQTVNPKSDNSISSANPNGLFEWILVLLFVFIVVVMIISIFYRYVLNDSLSWSDEVIRFSFVWFTFLGSVIVFRDNTHIRIDYLLEKLSPKMGVIVEKTGWFLIIGFYLFLFIAGMIWFFETQELRCPAYAVTVYFKKLLLTFLFKFLTIFL